MGSAVGCRKAAARRLGLSTTAAERRVIAWTLHMLSSDPEVAEAFDRQRYTGGAAL